MDVFVAEMLDRRLFHRVKHSLDPLRYIECGECGSVKVDTEDFIKVLYDFTEEYYEKIPDPSPYEEEIQEVLYEIYANIIKVILMPDNPDDPEFNSLAKLHGVNYPDVFCSDLSVRTTTYSEILLLVDRQCGCFKKIKDNSDEGTFEIYDAAAKGARILLIHTEKTIGSAIRRFLFREFGDKTHCASTTDEGLSSVRRRKPNLIFVQWREPELDPFDFYDKLRAIPGMEEIPVIFVGTFETNVREKISIDPLLSQVADGLVRRFEKDKKEFYPRLQELGVAGYLNQPYEMDELRDARTTVLSGGSYYYRQKETPDRFWSDMAKGSWEAIDEVTKLKE